MIKQKGVCDSCGKEYEFVSSFAIRIVGDEIRGQLNYIKVSHVADVIKLDDNYRHVCGKACLYRMIDEFIDKNGG